MKCECGVSDHRFGRSSPREQHSFTYLLRNQSICRSQVLEGHESSRVTKAIDIFSLGCVFYYVLSGGLHPFGDVVERQANIRKGRMNLAGLKDRNITAKGLIHQMLHADGNQRPSAAQITRHPTFWDNTKILNFFQEVSDRIEKEDHSSPVVRHLEKDGSRIINNANWIDQITAELQKDLRRYRSYRGTSVRDLLRALRNKVRSRRTTGCLIRSVWSCSFGN